MVLFFSIYRQPCASPRIAAIGIKKIDIDLQRHRRVDTVEFQIFDFQKRRKIR